MSANQKARQRTAPPSRQFYRCSRCRSLFPTGPEFQDHVRAHDWVNNEAPGFALSYTNQVTLPWCDSCQVVCDGPLAYLKHLAEAHGPSKGLPDIVRRVRRSL